MRINAPVEIFEAIYAIGYGFFTQEDKAIIDRALRNDKLNEKTLELLELESVFSKQQFFVAPQAHGMLERLNRCEKLAEHQPLHFELIQWLFKAIGEQYQNQLDDENTITKSGVYASLFNLKLRTIGVQQDSRNWLSLKLEGYQAMIKVLNCMLERLETFEKEKEIWTLGRYGIVRRLAFALGNKCEARKKQNIPNELHVQIQREFPDGDQRATKRLLIKEINQVMEKRFVIEKNNKRNLRTSH